MEFAHVGSHCTMPDCKQQDFLPFKCHFCGDIHCADHRRPDDHQCREGGYDGDDDNYVIVCPICQSPVSLKGFKKHENQSPEELAWNHHVDAGECKKKQ